LVDHLLDKVFRYKHYFYIVNLFCKCSCFQTYICALNEHFIEDTTGVKNLLRDKAFILNGFWQKGFKKQKWFMLNGFWEKALVNYEKAFVNHKKSFYQNKNDLS